MRTYLLDSSSTTPLYLQLYHAILQDIRTASLRGGDKLPSKRKLAQHLHISVATVELAYTQLIAEGYVYTKPKRGYFVESFDIDLPTASPTLSQPSLPIIKKSPAFAYDFRLNAVDTSCFPFSVWSKAMRTILQENPKALLSAPDIQGVDPLRQAIAEDLHASRGMTVNPAQIVVGAGTEYLLSLLLLLLGKQHTYAIENPGYPKIRQILEVQGISMCPIPVDPYGLRADLLEQSHANIVYLTPSHHFPLGVVMPISRRMELLQWASQRQGRYIIEDDYDSEFRYTSRPIPTLSSLGRSEQVIYLRTFARSLAPSLRLAYMILPPSLVRPFREKLGFFASTVPSFEQYALAHFLTSGAFERHIHRSRTLYKKRRDALIHALAHSALAPLLSIQGAEAGLHLLLTVQNGMEEQTLIRCAQAHGVRVYGLSPYYFEKPKIEHAPTVLLGYAGLSEEEIQQAVTLLEHAWMEKL